MAKRNNENMVKARLLVLSKMFYELTDEQNPMDTFQILKYLEKHGVPANNKTLRSDIALLKELGTDIVTRSSCSAAIFTPSAGSDRTKRRSTTRWTASIRP